VANHDDQSFGISQVSSFSHFALEQEMRVAMILPQGLVGAAFVFRLGR
jgi:hypothetical protein